MQRIPTLDGWRGLAIVLVLIDHFMPARGGVPIAPWLCLAQHGVTIFFVLSGYLITGKLLAEYERQGRIDLWSFYRRRARRLLPCVWGYLLFVWSYLSLREFLACFFIVRNYVVTARETTLHFWSLSVEEQFYLFWPAILILAGVRRARWVALAFAVGVAVFRFSHWSAYSVFPLSLHTEVHADALFAGCLAALVARHIPRLHPAWHAVAALLVLYGLHRYTVLIPLWESCLIALLIHASLTAPWGRYLNPLAGLGLVSYSVYVWQQAFALMIHHDASRLFYALLLIPAVWVSFTFLERPFMGAAQGPNRNGLEVPAAAA